MVSCLTEMATSLNWKNSMVKKFHHKKIFIGCQQQRKIFTTNYFHMNIFNNEFFPNYGIYTLNLEIYNKKIVIKIGYSYCLVKLINKSTCYLSVVIN